MAAKRAGGGVGGGRKVHITDEETRAQRGAKSHSKLGLGPTVGRGLLDAGPPGSIESGEQK